MIEASFGADRSAAVSGAYQHDRGQRLRLRGLPPPEVLAQLDELVDCDAVTVQAQYAFVGDSQTETRLAVWDEAQGAWTAAVPDVYMTRCEDVHVYVYVDYGQNEDGQRAKTCYEAVFRPESRPAPGDGVTPGQVNAWDALVQEVNLAIAGTNAATASANGEATAAREAADRANAAADNAGRTAGEAASEAVDTASRAADWLKGITATATTLAPGAAASAAILDGEAGPVLAIGVPEGIQGRPGVATINGVAVTDEGVIDLTPEDIGALPADTAIPEMLLCRIAMPAGEWTQDADGRYAQEAAVPGILETDAAWIDLDMTDATAQTAEALMEGWARVCQAKTMDGGIRVICLEEPPEVDMTVKVWVIR